MSHRVAHLCPLPVRLQSFAAAVAFHKAFNIWAHVREFRTDVIAFDTFRTLTLHKFHNCLCFRFELIARPACTLLASLLLWSSSGTDPSDERSLSIASLSQ